MKESDDRIRDLERHCEALENAIEEISSATFQGETDAPGA
jgi:hypothetical protein